MTKNYSNTVAVSRFVVSMLLSVLFVIVGCDGTASKTEIRVISNSELTDDSVSDFHNLAWLGVRSYPLTKALTFSDPNDSENSVSPGGLVVAEVLAKTPGDQAGLKKDDVIVAVDDSWVPIKDDPTLDVIRQLENRVTSAESATTLKVYRDGEIVSLTLANIEQSLDEGLPDGVVRFNQAATRGLQRLASQQNEDGSFGSVDLSSDSRLQLTAVTGLALLSAADSSYSENVEKCKQYVARQLSQMTEPAKGSPTPQDQNHVSTELGQPAGLAGSMMMQMPEIEIQPLTAAYVAQFLAEAKVSLMDQKWMSKLIGIVAALNQTQHASGAWNLSQDNEEGSVDVQATFVTNQVLLAIGMLERIGVKGNPETIKKACGYLTAQISARAGSGVDRRIKSALIAGTGAALFAINCQPSDPVLERAINDGLELIGEMHTSPTLNVPGMLSVATLARQSGDEDWLRFHEHAKLFLSAIASPDGQFVSIPTDNQEPLEMEINTDESVWEAAHCCLLLTMQTGSLKSLTGQTQSPMAVARNSSGEAVEGGPAGSAMPPGRPANGKMMFTLEDLSGEGSLEDQLKEKLKEMGIDSDNIKMSTQRREAPESPTKDDK